MLQTLPIEQALDAHHARLRPVIEALQARSRKLAPVFVPASATGFALRNMMLKLAPGAMLKRYFLNGLKTEQEAAAALFPQMRTDQQPTGTNKLALGLSSALGAVQ